MENINTALLTHYLEAQDKIAQQQIQIQLQQDEINDLTARLRSTLFEDSIIIAYLEDGHTVPETAKTLKILKSTVEKAVIQSKIESLEKEIENSTDQSLISKLKKELKEMKGEYWFIYDQESKEIYDNLD